MSSHLRGIPSAFSSEVLFFLKEDLSGEKFLLGTNSNLFGRKNDFDDATAFSQAFKSGSFSRWPTLEVHATIEDEIVLDGTVSEFKEVRSLSISGMSSSLYDLKIKLLNVTGSKINRISRSTILRVDVGDWVERLELRDCKIGVLEFSSNRAVGDILIENCEIGELRILPECSFRDIKLKKVKFSRKRWSEDPEQQVDPEKLQEIPILDRASYSYLLGWATSNGNSEVAHIARGQDLALEKLEARGGEWFVLFVWESLSLYGLSLARPLFWFLFSFVVLCIIFMLEGSSFALQEEQVVGWRSLLTDPRHGQIARAIVGAVEGFSSPLSVFSVKRLVVPDSWWLALLQPVFGYFWILLIFLFGLSVRRRFKI